MLMLSSLRLARSLWKLCAGAIFRQKRFWGQQNWESFTKNSLNLWLYWNPLLQLINLINSFEISWFTRQAITGSLSERQMIRRTTSVRGNNKAIMYRRSWSPCEPQDWCSAHRTSLLTRRLYFTAQWWSCHPPSLICARLFLLLPRLSAGALVDQWGTSVVSVCPS